jgi:uncharacterized membrane protein YfcA
MHLSEPTLLVLLILFLSTLTRSTLGFGDALVAMPLLALTVGMQPATPLVALFSTTIALIIAGANWHKVDLRVAWRLIVASLLGIPIGLLLLTHAPEAVVKGLLGLVLILFGLYNLTRPALPALHQPGWAYGFGFIAGILGGAYNTNGPPIVMYGALRRWPPERFRATLQGYFVPTGGFIALSHGLAGLWTGEVFQFYLLAFPFVLAAIFLGGKLNGYIPAQRFERLLYLALIVLGVVLIS